MASKMRENILTVATDLFNKQGINATSVDTIVATADIAKVTLYKYFKSKEQLIIAYLQDSDQKLWSKVTSRIKKKDARGQLQELAISFLDLIGEPDFKGFAFINASVEFPQSDNAIYQASMEFSRNLKLQVTKLANEAGIKNPDVLAMQLQLVIEGASLSYQDARGPALIKSAKSMVKVLIDSAQ